jgi:hypothetical protein
MNLELYQLIIVNMFFSGPEGWVGEGCDEPICEQECQNGGVCSAPDTCNCMQ